MAEEEEVLSEGEIDALMDTYSDESGQGNSTASSGECEPFDFSTREQTLLAQMPALKKLNEQHALALAACIADQYGFSAQVSVAEIELMKLDQALANISDPSAINLAKISPLSGTSYVVLPGALLSFFVDMYFGGSHTNTVAEFTRESLTRTELRVNEVMVERFFSTLTQAWSEKVPLTAQLAGFETKPTYLQAGSPDDMALRFPFEIKVGEWVSTIDWIAPYAALEPLRQTLGSLAVEAKPQQKNSDWENHFVEELNQVLLDVSGTFDSGHVSIAEILELKPGAIVPLKMPADVTLSIENVPFYTGEHGVLNGNKSIKVKDVIRNDS
ncbi:MAG: flagellar motor switch protein FliM [Halioglobus sp.]